MPLAMIAPAAQAQQTSNSTVNNFGDLDALEVSGANQDKKLSNQVSAFRTGTPLIDVPQSLTVLTREQFEEQGIDSIADVIDYTPGVTNSQGEGHRDSVVFRGTRSTADFFVDGVRDDVQYFRSLYNVEQVEILRGPNSLTFGRGGVGGVLNRVLKKAEIGDDFGEIQGRVNTFGGVYSQFDYNKTLSDNFALRLNVFGESLENHRDFFDGERLGINPTLTWKLSEDTTLHFAYEYSDHQRFIDRGVPSVNGRPASFLSDTTFGDSELNETTLDAHTFRATLKHQFSDAWKGSLTGFYGTYDKVYANYFPSDFNLTDNEVEIDGYIDRTDRQNFVLSGDLIGEFRTGGIEHKLLIGAEYVHTSSDQNRFNNVWDTNSDDQEFFSAANFRLRNGVVTDPAGGVLGTGTFSDLNDDTRVTIDVYSLFLQDEIALNDRLDLILGARFDSFDIEVFNAVAGETRTRRDEEITPRVGLVYKPAENVSFYASYSETFLPRSGEQFANINGSRDALAPDEFSNLEAGVKWNICDDLSFALSAFQIEASSAQPGDIAGTFDVIDSQTDGFEAQLKGRINDQWRISAGYSYLDGEQINLGGTPREQPTHTFSIWNSFKVSEKFGFGLGMIYVDESFADNGNSVTLPSYVRVDTSAYYNFSESFRVQLNIENLLDKEYFPNSHTANNITVGAPINATLKFSKSF